MVVIDTLQKFRAQSARGLETYASDYEAIATLQRLASEKRIAIVLIHHTRKSDASDPFDKISGTTGITGAADCSWVLTKERNKKTAILNITGRDVTEQELALDFDEATCRWFVRGNVAEVICSEKEQELLDFIEESPDPVSPMEVAEALEITTGTAKMRLMRLQEKKRVEKVRHGRYIISSTQKVTTAYVTAQSATLSVSSLQSNKV